jgi:soluble lytic murein transglycosylase-like protein
MRSRKGAWICLLLGFCLIRPVWADIYMNTSDSGVVALSNVPTDGGYTVLIAAPKQAVATIPEARAPEAKARTPGSLRARKARYDQIVDEVSQAHGIESALLHAVISVESRYNPKALSKKGAAGLMQLMPGTAKRYGVTDAFDPAQNLGGGAKYLRHLLKMFNSDVGLALAAFNAGEYAVVKHGNRIPPYRETLHYVPKVLDYYQHYRVAGGL